MFRGTTVLPQHYTASQSRRPRREDDKKVKAIISDPKARRMNRRSRFTIIDIGYHILSIYTSNEVTVRGIIDVLYHILGPHFNSFSL
jgi:hypothetical protein